MENRVGAVLPTPEEAAAVLESVRKIRQQIEAWTTLLTSEERQRTLKPRTGGEEIAGTICEVAEQTGTALPDVPLAELRADQQLINRLKPLDEEVSALQQRLGDTLLQARSELWWSTTAYYTALRRVADRNPEVQLRLAPVVAFFASGRRK